MVVVVVVVVVVVGSRLCRRLTEVEVEEAVHEPGSEFDAKKRLPGSGSGFGFWFWLAGWLAGHGRFQTAAHATPHSLLSSLSSQPEASLKQRCLEALITQQAVIWNAASTSHALSYSDRM